MQFPVVAKHLKLLPDESGNVTINKKFWNNDTDLETINPFLIYAELIKSNNPRYLETAEKIYKHYVENNL